MNDTDKTLQASASACASNTQTAVSDALILIPMRNVVLFPGMAIPITIGREQSLAAAQEAVNSGRKIGLLLQSHPEIDEPQGSDLYATGTIANILRYVTTPGGTHHLVVQGEERFRVLDYVSSRPYLAAHVEVLPEEDGSDSDIQARMRHLQEKSIETVQLLPQAPPEISAAIQGMGSAGALADLVSNFLDISPQEKQRILETMDLRERLDKVSGHVRQQLEVLKLTREIDEQTKQSMDARQREFMLRERLKAIQKELGDDDDGNDAEIEELRQAIADANMPQEAADQAAKELKRLQKMSEASGEYSMIRTYLDWLVDLPWSKLDEENIDIAKARAVLDADHYGLDKIKKRILEYLAVRKLNPEGRSPILCFAGPPGVGKTSLGQSIARALGLQFVRASLGGTHDEAEIRGHRRTYLGALPGNIIQEMRKAGTRNPVFMLDEIDKLGSGGFHGDPASALLEVLDPAQNGTFRDNYLALPFDLSKVVFIATANVLDAIPGPLRDRMEIISLPGYTEDEKVEIAKRYLLKRQLETNGLTSEQAQVSEDALRAIVTGYTREAGVRNLEREIGSVLRHAAMQVSEGTTIQVNIGPDDLHAILGPQRFESEVAMRTSTPGVATGMAWTPVGGDILFIETTKMPGKGRLTITGQLGDVMKESAQAALSLIKSRARQLGINQQVFEEIDIHLHVPAGAIPKDGPSAGVSIFTALVSLLTEQKVRSDVAMTGEISLRGLVLPIGGVKEKCLAALRAGIHTVLLPARNRRDWEDVPANARGQLQVIWLETVEDVLAAALEANTHQTELKSAA
ncbi:endopeptidase La [Candidatus Thiothrix sp. Deng01]|uniref:Lon protease n=1 Tax=Candidatus Thiothrix phosphatis TaxID=3112415 RepID=A0ABU6CYF5_9GAMM|nr:endopeptidase La [Candidatus Thiothrix sp. Deng01]MEB4591112.1 endopeptidase La [Candidatus Thiothrix sp. Deng01]